MGKCDKCGYETLKWGDYYKDDDSGVCLCEECYDGVDYELVEDLLGHKFSPVTVGLDDIDTENDDNI